MADKEVTSSERFPTASPAAGKGLLFGVCPFVSLDMLHTPEALAAILARQCLGFLLPGLTIFPSYARASVRLPLYGLEWHHFVQTLPKEAAGKGGNRGYCVLG